MQKIEPDLGRYLAMASREVSRPANHVLRIASVALSLGLLGSVAPPASSKIWLVEWDAEDRVSRVGRVVAQAASGDTIEIGPGEYIEHIPLESKSLTLIGVQGAEFTILSGETEIPEREGSILYTSADYEGQLRIEGLTFRGGTGTLLGLLYKVPWGGGIYIKGGVGGTSSIEIRNCRFEGNKAHRPGSIGGSGGAVVIDGNLHVRIVDCRFVDNYAYDSGGSLWLQATGEVRGCDFQLGDFRANSGAALTLYGDLLVESNTFHNDAALHHLAACVSSWSRDVTLRGNTFLAVGSDHACRLFLAEPLGWGAGNVDLVVENNRFWTDVISEERIINIVILRDTGITRLSGNTMVRCATSVDCNAGTIAIDHNIFAGGWIFLASTGGGSARCNVSWPDSLDDYLGNLAWEKNVVADPLFCEDAPGAFDVSGLSPCRPTHSDGCGIIGGVEVGCDFEPVERTSWGKLKNLFPKGK